MKLKYYVFRWSRYGGPFAADYWTGDFTEGGKPRCTNQPYRAKAFDTAREAYAEAGKHRFLQYFRVGRREPESIH